MDLLTYLILKKPNPCRVNGGDSFVEESIFRNAPLIFVQLVYGHLFLFRLPFLIYLCKIIFDKIAVYQCSGVN